MGIFEPKTTDFELSPYTGMTRQSWIEAGKYMLEGVFNNLKSIDDPVVMPRKDVDVTYPHKNMPEDVHIAEVKAEIFEGLTRSFFIASVLIHEEPELTINGIKLRDYYGMHILRSCIQKDSPEYVSTYEELENYRKYGNPHQQTVETCALVIGLWAAKAEIWDAYSKEEKDALAAFLRSYADNTTVPQNWRLFNMLDMAFLYQTGYEINEKIMLEHAQAILNFYSGDGWYRDGHTFDYYSVWAFQFYAPLWNLWYGYEKEPYFAEQFEKNSNELMKTYAWWFDRDGFTNMWGRSCIYRFAALSAFDGNMLLKNSDVVNKKMAGAVRRIASGSLMQFLTRDDFLSDGIPTLGFYGQFMPLVQGYSCAESPFWLGKGYLFMHLPADHPFWTEKEEDIWESLGENEVKRTVLDGPALLFSNHKANGETILRTGKVTKNKDDLHGIWNYGKLCYNTKYPWESTPVEGKDLGIDSQQYVLKNAWDDKLQHANATFWAGEKDEVLYRRQFFDYSVATDQCWLQAVNLADMTVPYGILRADKLRLFYGEVSVTLGSYGFPDNGTSVLEKEESTLEGLKAKAIILTGKDYKGNPKQMAMTIYTGFSEMGIVHSEGTNPDSDKSMVIYAKMQRKDRYNAAESYVLISQVITKESAEPFSDADIFPLRNIVFADKYKTGAYGEFTLEFKNGEKKVVDYLGIEGRLSL